MVLQQRPHVDAKTMQFVIDEMRRAVDRGDFPPVEVSEACLVSVVMDERLRLQAVSLQSPLLEREQAAELEVALVKAFNHAMGEVMRRTAERLTRAVAEADSYLPSEG